MTEQSILHPDLLEHKIYLIRGQKVMLDSDLAILYGVPTFRLNEQVRRNIGRFPEDFMFQLSADETRNLISQFAISSLSHGGRRKPALVFTEQGVAMLSSVLNSDRAVQVNIAIMRTFVKLRKLITDHAELGKKIDALEKNYDKTFREIFEVLRRLMKSEEKPKREIGFRVK